MKPRDKHLASLRRMNAMVDDMLSDHPMLADYEDWMLPDNHKGDSMRLWRFSISDATGTRSFDIYFDPERYRSPIAQFRAEFGDTLRPGMSIIGTNIRPSIINFPRLAGIAR